MRGTGRENLNKHWVIGLFLPNDKGQKNKTNVTHTTTQCNSGVYKSCIHSLTQFKADGLQQF